MEFQYLAIIAVSSMFLIFFILLFIYYLIDRHYWNNLSACEREHSLWHECRPIPEKLRYEAIIERMNKKIESESDQKILPGSD